MDVFILSAKISCAVVALIYLWKVLDWVWFTPKKLEKILRQQGFKGNSYKLFYGDFKEIGKITGEALSKPMEFTNDIAHRATPIVHHATKTYGDDNFVWFGPRPAVCIREPEIIREILSKNNVYLKPTANSLGKMFKGVGTYEKEQWAKHRKLINPAFHVEKLKHMVPAFHVSTVDMLKKWDAIVPDSGSCEADVWPYLQTMTSDVISRTVFGSSYEEGNKIFKLQREQVERINEAGRHMPVPGWLPTKNNRRMKEIMDEIESRVLGVIRKRVKAMEEGEPSTNDLLGMLLESNANEVKQNGTASAMSMEEVMEECKVFYFVGQETSVCLLVWTMILLSKHEDWQTRARDEALERFGKGKPDYQELNHLKTMNMILHEALRLYTPGATLARLTYKEANFGKYTIPAGVQMQLPLLAMHHDTRLWGDDAAIFNPERFSQGVSKATQGRPIYIPFGSGPRVCIGQNFTMVEVKMAMVMILQNYSFKLSPSYTHAPHHLFTLQPQHGAHLILTKL
ncbi:cytochrome P450 72A225-like [Salvia hispanica]|uniref:cytochrome P450 72A225-like n=1 Tax=Salvia hispanica TaxID=49212 RepID=UPI002009B9E2|nr:cytochrome P450 72A225-like [Salvia hispanica]